MKIKKSIKKIFDLYRFFFSNYSRKIFLFYFILIFIGGALLILPISIKSHTEILTNHKWNFLDALFTSVSAITDTGLVIGITNSQFSVFALIIILLLIQIGGIGVVSFKISLLFLFRRKKILYNDIQFMQNEKGLNSAFSSTRMLKTSIAFIFISEIIGTIILTLYFCFSNAGQNFGLEHNFVKSLWYSIFSIVSCINNCGFELFGTLRNGSYSSISCFANNSFILIFFAIIIIIGGIGFPIFSESIYYFKKRFYFRKNDYFFAKEYKFMLFSYFIIFFISWIILLILAFTNSAGNQLDGFSPGKKILNTFFLDISSRNAGFSTLNINDLSKPFKIILSLLMWIGANPFSTGGGIRSTTFILVFIVIYSKIKNYQQIKTKWITFKHELAHRACIVFIFSLFLIFIGFFIFSFSNNKQFNLYSIIIELTSAFGTSGISSGITPFLKWYEIIFLIILMIIGQLTISTFLTMGRRFGNNPSNLYLNKETSVLIG